MIKTLPERIKEKHIEYKNAVKQEKILEDILFNLPTLHNVSVSNHSYSSMLSLRITTTIDHIEEIEIDLFSEINDYIGDIRWTKSVTEEAVLYSEYTPNFKGTDLHFKIKVAFNDSCFIEKIPTGKTRMVHKSVQVEEPIFEVVYNCAK